MSFSYMSWLECKQQTLRMKVCTKLWAHENSMIIKNILDSSFSFFFFFLFFLFFFMVELKLKNLPSIKIYFFILLFFTKQMHSP